MCDLLMSVRNRHMRRFTFVSYLVPALEQGAHFRCGVD